MSKPKTNPVFIVTRQIYYYQEGQPAVEIAVGSIDSVGADALAAQYPKLGEFAEFEDPRDAVKAAIAVRDAWKNDLGEEIVLTYGAPGLLGIEPTEKDEEEVKAWAERAYQNLHKCDQCGDILPAGCIEDGDTGEKFCREHCWEKAMAARYAEVEEDLAAAC